MKVIMFAHRTEFFRRKTKEKILLIEKCDKNGSNTGEKVLWIENLREHSLDLKIGAILL